MKQRVADSISAMHIDIPKTPITPSPSTELDLSDAITTVESGVVISPRSAYCGSSLEDIIETSKQFDKVKVERTYSDKLNQNSLDYSDVTSNTEFHDSNLHVTLQPTNNSIVDT